MCTFGMGLNLENLATMVVYFTARSCGYALVVSDHKSWSA